MKRLALFLLCLLLPIAPQAESGRNNLAQHPSPYLAMHGDDPVHWQDWGEDPLQQARSKGKLLFVSSGYFACHWCHVMQRESYQDKTVAEFLNRHFIAVKVDRELEPALDAHLIAFVQRTQGQAGWPLNVFLTPEGYPLYGLTYAPRERFLKVLARLQAAWQKDPEDLARLAREAGEQGRNEGENDKQVPLTRERSALLEQALIQTALGYGDDLQGGFGRTTKFPDSPQLLALLEVLERREHGELREFLILTLDQMARLGLNDRIGGGFFRYTTDPDWQTPHFEKMLYDNAQLTQVYLLAARVLERPDHIRVARDSMDFMLRELWDESAGAFMSSLSAVDDQGREGYSYLWDSETLERLLSAGELAVARAAWNLSGPPTFDYGRLPQGSADRADLAGELSLPAAQVDTHLTSARQKLLHARQARPVPVDTKLLAAWNGLALSALARLQAQAPDARYAAAGKRLSRFLATVSWDGNQLRRSAHGGKPLGNAGLEDYAYVARGLVDWQAVSPDHAVPVLVKRMLKTARERFHDGRGWNPGKRLLIPGAGTERRLPDKVMPSPSAVLTALSLEFEPTAVALSEEEFRQLGRAAFGHATEVALLGRLAAANKGQRGQSP